MKEQKKMSFLTGAAYGCGNLAANLLVTTASAFISYFYTEVAGISIGIVGIILMVCRLTDGASDLVMGAVVDKTKSKYGKARIWVLRMAPLFCLASILLWYAPDFNMTGKIIYASLTYILSIAIVYTAISVPYNTLCSLITKDPTERTALSSFRTFFGFAGAMSLNVVTLRIVNAFGGGQKGWFCLGIIYGILGGVLYLITFAKCKEIDVEEEETIQTENKVPVMENIKALFKNKYWLMVIGMILITFTVSGFTAVNVYYAQYIFGDENLVGPMSIAAFLPLMVGAVIITPVVKKFGKRNVALAGCCVSLVGSIVMALFPENWNLFFMGMWVKGFGSAPLAVASFAMLADTIEYGEWKTGIRSDGMAYSAEGFGEKVGGALGGILMSAMMSVGGYVANQTVQSASTILAMKAAMCYIPLLTIIVSIIILKCYDLDKIYPQIMSELEERRHKVK